MAHPSSVTRSRKALPLSEALEGLRVKTILAAAVALIGREGPAAATMQRIADRAGIAKGTLYLYVKDRDDLLRRATHHVLDEWRRRVAPLLGATGPFERRLRALLRTGLEVLEEYRGFLRFRLQTPKVLLRRRSAHSPEEPGLRDLAAFLARAMRRGEIRRGDPERLARFVHESMTMLALRRLAETRPASLEADLNWIVDMLLHGMSARRRSPS